MKKIIAYVHTHWDREWYREFEEFRLRLIEVVDEILERLQSGDLPEFYFDGQTIALEDYFPAQEDFKKLERRFDKITYQKEKTVCRTVLLFGGSVFDMRRKFNSEFIIRVEKILRMGRKRFHRIPFRYFWTLRVDE